MSTNPLSPLLSLDAVAKSLGIAKRTVHRLIASGELPPPLRIGKLSRLSLDDVHAYIEKLKGQRKSNA